MSIVPSFYQSKPLGNILKKNKEQNMEQNISNIKMLVVPTIIAEYTYYRWSTKDLKNQLGLPSKLQKW